jgi:predicted enzyme related to lactoylglutathione lyase
MKIKEIAFIRYPVLDIARSRDFYESILGLKATSVYEGKHSTWIEYNIGGTVLAIVADKDMPGPTAEGVCVALEVDNFDGFVSALKKKKVKFFQKPFETGVCRMAVISDPDGSRIVIHKRNK